MAEIKEVKYGNLSINATHWAAKGKESFEAYALKKYDKRPIFAKRDIAARKKWVEEIWKLIQIETGTKTVAKSKESDAAGAA